MITIKTIASGSTGNAYHVTDGYSPILVECGVQFRRIQKAINFKVSELAGCLISHSHKDHCMAIKDVMKAGVDCYLTAGTAEKTGIKHHRIKTIEPKKQFKLASWTVLPFRTKHHDVDGTLMDSVGFLLQNKKKEKLLFITDSYYVEYVFSGLNYIMLEANYALDILMTSSLPSAHKKRIMKSHFSLENVKEFLKANDLSRCREIHLLHLSAGNSDAGRFKREIEGLAGIPTTIAGI